MSSLFKNFGGNSGPRNRLFDVMQSQLNPKASETILGKRNFFTALDSAAEARKLKVWAKGHLIDGYNEKVWRRDDYGRVMRYSDHGDRHSTYGWEIDHIVSKALGGTDDLSNLRPLNAAVNATLGGILGSALRGQ